MFRILLFISLFTIYAVYSAVVYSKGTRDTVPYDAAARADILHGKHLYQQYNCTACHQLYGLGGYLGPELTTACSDPLRGEVYMRAFLQAGGTRMPNFHFSKEQIDALISYLCYVDETAITYK
jgi:nitric oxide reductase subunit C